MPLDEKPSLAVKIGFFSFFGVGILVGLCFAIRVQSRGESFVSSVFAGAIGGTFGAWFLFAAVFWLWQALRRVRRWFAA